MPKSLHSAARRSVAPILILALAAAGFGLWKYFRAESNAPEYRFAKAERGSVTSVVSASGTLNAVTTVLVGSQISGQIRELFVDFNSPVKKGQLLARIDPETFELKVRQAEADVEAARTTQLTRQSDVAAQRSQLLRAKIQYNDVKRDLERKETLFNRNFISGTERDKAFYNEQAFAEAVRTAEAQVKSAEAQVANAAAIVRQREAALASTRADLARTAIVAPVDGVVISRQIDAGQTVAASLNTPTLFSIAQDLSEMQVDVAIDESDIGKIRPDQRVTFTVDAYPTRTFEGRVKQIRKAAQTVQNVVTYTVVVGTGNPNLSLVPGMTANVRIVADSRENIIKVANAALRWRPVGATTARGAATPSGLAQAAGGDARARRAKLVAELKLDSGQQARLDEIFARLRAKMIVLRDVPESLHGGRHLVDGLDEIFASLREKMIELRDVPEADRRLRAERIRAETRRGINSMLNVDQQQTYAQIIAAETGRASGGATGRVYVLTPAGKPMEITLRTGLSDGNATEIVAGELKEGAEVIVGTLAVGRATKAPSGAPGMRF